MGPANERRDVSEYPITVGGTTPGFAVVACSHGDEISGKIAVDCLLRTRPRFTEPVKFLIGNEEATRRGDRFVDEDLNRAFTDGGDDTYERRRAAEIRRELGDCKVLDVHSTESSPTPFVTLQRLNPITKSLARATGVGRAVDISEVEGGLIGAVDGVALEVGPKGTPEAVGSAHRHLCNFLGATGIADLPASKSDPILYRVTGKIGTGDEEFVGTNFEKVAAEEVFAYRNGTPVRAETEFYPVLMSDDGYDEFLGFRAEDKGRLSEIDGNE